MAFITSWTEPAGILPPNPEILFGHNMPTDVAPNATPNTDIASSHARFRNRRRFTATSGVSGTGAATAGGGGPGIVGWRDFTIMRPDGPANAPSCALRRSIVIAISRKPM